MGIPMAKTDDSPAEPGATVHRSADGPWRSGRVGVVAARGQLDPLVDTLTRAAERATTTRPSPVGKHKGTTI